jgi:hypothetical protein
MAEFSTHRNKTIVANKKNLRTTSEIDVAPARRSAATSCQIIEGMRRADTEPCGTRADDVSPIIVDRCGGQTWFVEITSPAHLPRGDKQTINRSLFGNTSYNQKEKKIGAIGYY